MVSVFFLVNDSPCPKIKIAVANIVGYINAVGVLSTRTSQGKDLLLI